MLSPAWVGFAAAICTTFSLFPQIVRIWRTKQAESISLPAFVIFSTGVSLWLIYGILIKDWPLIGSNVITLLLSSTVVALSLKFRNKT